MKIWRWETTAESADTIVNEIPGEARDCPLTARESLEAIIVGSEV